MTKLTNLYTKLQILTRLSIFSNHVQFFTFVYLFCRNSARPPVMLQTTSIYHPRDQFRSPLWNILHNNYEEFKTNYDESYEKQYSFFRSVVNDVVNDYLKCGNLKERFARVRCTNPDCRNEYLLAFSCKGRWFCPSCHSKKVIKFGEDVCNNILYPVPHRQFVFSIPILLRAYFKYDQELLTEFCHLCRGKF